MTERKDGNKDFGLLRLACHLIDNFKSVTGKINIHLVCGIVLDMADDLDVELVLADCPLEGRQLKTVRIFSMILLKQFSDTHSFACQAGYISGKQSLQFNPFGRRLPTSGFRTDKHLMQLLLGKGEKLIDAFPT